MKRIFWLTLFFLLITVPAFGTDYYVDNAASGSNNGTSWTNAWTSLASASAVSAGDTVYISGGAVSKDYTVATMTPKAGTTGSPVTYKIGQASPHNGTANITISGGGTFVTQNYVVVSGDAGDGARHFNFVSGGRVIHNTNAKEIRVSYVIRESADVLFYLQLASYIEIDNCWLKKTQLVYTSAIDKILYAEFDYISGVYDRNKIHHNQFFVPIKPYATGIGMGDDGLRPNGESFSIYNNSFETFVDAAHDTYQHSDGIHSLAGSYFKIYNNTFKNFGNYGIFMEGRYVSPGMTNGFIYNNIVTITENSMLPLGNGMAGIVVGPGVNNIPFNNVHIWNNTVADYTGNNERCITFEKTTRTGITFTDCSVRNNVCVNSGGNSLDAAVTNSNNSAITSAAAPTNFASYSAFSTTNDFHLRATSSLINAGYDLSAYFTTDKDGFTRTGGFDIGAYELQTEDHQVPTMSSTLNGTHLTCTAESMDVTVPVKTNENATCRISTTNQTFAAMTSAKNMAGAGTMNHTSQLTGQSCDTTITRYVQCQDASPFLNTTVTPLTITFYIDAGVTSEEPIMSGQVPTTGTVLNCTSNPRAVGLELTTNKDATCKYSTTDQAYALMPNTYSTPVASPLARSGRWMYYNGSPVWLVGYDIQWMFNYADEAGWHDTVKGHIDTMASYGINTFRLWLNTWYSDPNPDEYGIHPWSYDDETGKFDLDTWNATYWTNWTTLLTYAKSKGMFVEIVLFAEVPYIVGGSNAWYTASGDRAIWNAWREDENINGEFADVSGDFWPQFWTWNYTEGSANLTTYQKALAAKAVNTFNSLGNVFFQVSNEYPAAWNSPVDGTFITQVYDWQQRMADYVSSLGAIVSVHSHEGWGMNLYGLDYWKTRASVGILNFHPYSTPDSNANINSIGTLFASEGLQTADKILMIDESWGIDFIGAETQQGYDATTTRNAAIREAFASFVNGIYYLAYLEHASTTGGASWIVGANALKTLKNISSLVSWWEMSRDKTRVTAGPGQYWEGMSKAGEYYVYYFTGTRTTTAVSMTLPTGTYDYKWYDTLAWDPDGIASGTVAGATPASITAPSATAWEAASGVVLVIIKQGVSPVVGTQTHNATEAALACGQEHVFYSRCTAEGVTNTTSAVTRFSIAPGTPTGLTEAENGTLAIPMASVPDLNASNGYYIRTTSPGTIGGTDGGTATFTVTVTTAGTYRIVAKWYAPDGGTDSMFLKVNALDEIIWDFNPSGSTANYNVWKVSAVTGRGTGTIASPQYSPYLVILTADDHTFVFRGREINARLDYFYLVPEPVSPIQPEGVGGMRLGSGPTTKTTGGATTTKNQ